jgi:hypothetical protein
MLLPCSAEPGPRYGTSPDTQYNKHLSPRLHHDSLIAFHPSRAADDNLLLVAGGTELSVPATDSSVFTTSVAGGADLKRVVRVGRTIGAVGAGAPALAVEVANLGILADENIPNQHSTFISPCSVSEGLLTE